MVVAIASPVLPALTSSVDANWNIRLSYSLGVIWLVLLVVAFFRHRWRGIWLLIGLPIVLFWPLAFKLLEYACRHEESAPVYSKAMWVARSWQRSVGYARLYGCPVSSSGPTLTEEKPTPHRVLLITFNT